MGSRVIAGRYELLREVGRGGMATVFLALDAKHQREVALKALRPDLAAVVGSERFLREIEITAQLNHPHILPLLDSGTEDGFYYYVMPYVAGGSLRLLLDGERLPLEAVVRVTREVASALDHAHARDVIHRDVKPENILFNEGLAVVSDFGIAKAMSGATSRMTGTGLSVGTLGYMSPEQALGTTEIDIRSDVYSLGSVVYEMLVGETPAAWPSAEDVDLGRFEELPEAHRERLDGLPGRVQQVLVKALALRPQHRYDSAGELAAALSTASERTAPFSDDQVRRLLRRAAEIQAKQPTPRPGDLTIGHVEQIAAQVGIPPENVREAARELGRGAGVGAGSAGGEGGLPATDATGRGSAVGGVEAVVRSAQEQVVARMDRDWKKVREEWNRLVAKQTVEAEVPVEVFPAMVAEIDRTLKMVGHTSIVGQTLTWSPATQNNNTRRVVIQVAAADGRTTIRIQEDLAIRGAAGIAPVVGGFFGMAFGGALGQAIGAGDAGGLLLIFAAAGVLGAIRAVIGIAASENGPVLKALAGRLADMGRQAAGLPPAERDALPTGGPDSQDGESAADAPGADDAVDH